MTKQELAKILDGREYGKEITYDESKQAKAAGLVVVYGASDDLMKFDGAIRDEIGCFDGGTAYLTESGLFENKCDDEDCPYSERERAKCKTIEAVWCDSGDHTWTYKTSIPHVTFIIMDGGVPYCRGIVFDINDLRQ